MTNLTRLLAQGLLLLGVAVVFLGINTALGFTPGNLLISLAAVAGLLYAGATWFGAAAPRSHATAAGGHGWPIVFDAQCCVVSGPRAGQPVATQFPEIARGEIELQCASVLAGRPAQFPCTWEGQAIVFDALPVRDGDGAIVYGLLIPASSRLGIAAEERAIHMVG
jgi:hypothetical protein